MRRKISAVRCGRSSRPPLRSSSSRCSSPDGSRSRVRIYALVVCAVALGACSERSPSLLPTGTPAPPSPGAKVPAAAAHRRASRASSTRRRSASPAPSTSTSASSRAFARSPPACWRRAGVSLSTPSPTRPAAFWGSGRGSSCARIAHRRRIVSPAGSRSPICAASSSHWRGCSRGAGTGKGSLRPGAGRGREGDRRQARFTRARPHWGSSPTGTCSSRTTRGSPRRSPLVRSRRS